MVDEACFVQEVELLYAIDSCQRPGGTQVLNISRIYRIRLKSSTSQEIQLQYCRRLFFQHLKTFFFITSMAGLLPMFPRATHKRISIAISGVCCE